MALVSVAAASLRKIFGLLALAMAAVNIFGGFLVTQRMLSMYKKKGESGEHATVDDSREELDVG